MGWGTSEKNTKRGLKRGGWGGRSGEKGLLGFAGEEVSERWVENDDTEGTG